MSDERIRLSVNKLFNMLQKYNLAPSTLYTIDGFVRIIEVIGRRPFMIFVPEKYLLPIAKERGVAMKQVDTEESSLLTPHTLFGVASMSYPILTTELDGYKTTFNLCSKTPNIISKGDMVTQRTDKERIKQLEQRTDNVLKNSSEITIEEFENAPIIDPPSKNHVQLVFIDPDGEPIESSPISTLIAGIPEKNTDINIEPNDTLSVILPIISLSELFAVIKKTPKQFSKELLEAYMRRDIITEKRRIEDYNRVQNKIEEWQKRYIELNSRIVILNNEEQRLTSILDRIDITNNKTKNKTKFTETELIHLQTLELRREAEIEKLQIETRIEDSLNILLTTFDYLDSNV